MSDNQLIDDFLKNFISGSYEIKNDFLMAKNVCYMYTTGVDDPDMATLDIMMHMMKKVQFYSLNTAGFIGDGYLDEIIDDPNTRAIVVYTKSDIDNFDELKERMESEGRFLVCLDYANDDEYDDVKKLMDHVWGTRKTNPDYL